MGGAGEALGQVAQEGRVKNWADVWFEVIGEGFGTPSEVASMSFGRLKDVYLDHQNRIQAAAVAEQSARFVERLFNLAKADKVLSRDSDTFERFIARAAEETPVTQVFIDGKALMQSGLAEPLAEISPSVAEQAERAATTGALVAIPVEEFATRIAPTAYAQPLLEHIKTDPEGFSRAEARDYMEHHAAELQADVERALVVEDAVADFRASQERVKETILNELNQLGRFTPKKNEADATLLAAHMAVRAAQLGITPEAMFEKARVRFTAESILGNTLEQPAYTPDEILAMFDGVPTINIEAPGIRRMSEQEKADAEAQFVSTRPAGETHYARGSRRVTRLRALSEAISNELGGMAETARIHAEPLGPFSRYEVTARITPADEFYNPGGTLKIFVYGAEQSKAGLTDEPALTFTVTADGELSVNGPIPDGPTFNAFKERGWATYATNSEGGIAEGHSRLIDPNTKDGKLPIPQVMSLLADIHARVREWRGTDVVGLHWSRSTGAMGGLFTGENGGNLLFQKARGAYSPENDVIALFQKADLSTMLHETGHFFFESDIRLAAELIADAKIFGMDTIKPGEQQIIKDVSALLSWHGIQGDIDSQLQQWYNMSFEEKRGHHERTAEAFEAYLFEGKAPALELAPLFQTFRAWLTRVYRSIRDFFATHPEAGKINDVKFDPGPFYFFGRGPFFSLTWRGGWVECRLP